MVCPVSSYYWLIRVWSHCATLQENMMKLHITCILLIDIIFLFCNNYYIVSGNTTGNDTPKIP